MSDNAVLIKIPDDDEILEVAEIEAECFSHPWSFEDFKKHRADGLLLTALSGGEVAAYISVSTALDEAYVNTLACREKFRRQGITKKLLSAATDRLKAEGMSFLSLEVRSRNTAAIRLYESALFEAVGRRRGFYRDPPDDAIIMTVKLKETA